MSKQNAACNNAETLPCTHKLNQALINIALKLNRMGSKEATYEKSESNRMTGDNRAFVLRCKQEKIFGNNGNFSFMKVEEEMNFWSIIFDLINKRILQRVY